MSGDFFPYHPLRLRLWLAGLGLVALGLSVWAVLGLMQTESPLEIFRAGLSFGLAAAFGFAFFRFRPRRDWGVRITPLAVLVSRPRRGLIEVSWSAVKEIAVPTNRWRRKCVPCARLRGVEWLAQRRRKRESSARKSSGSGESKRPVSVCALAVAGNSATSAIAIEAACRSGRRRTDIIARSVEPG